MEGRRASGRSRLRSSPVGEKNAGRKSPSGRSVDRKSPLKPSTPTRKSPSRRYSPSKRTSPSRRASPARRASPGKRKSPARKSPSRKTPPKRGRPKSINVKAQERPATPAQESVKEKKIEEKLSKTEVKSSPSKLNASPEKKDLKTSSSLHSVHTTYSSSTVTSSTVETVDIGATKAEDTSGDSELAKLTSLAAFVRRSVSVAKNLTPTPTATTEQSRHSRSVSRSVYEDDYSKTEYSDNEHEEQFESFHTDLTRNSYATKAKISRDIPAPREFGAVIVSLLLLLIPAMTYYLQWTCKKGSCNFKKIDFSLLGDEIVKEVLSREKVGAYIGFTSFVLTFSAFPFGRIVKLYNDRGTAEYYFNSLAVAILATIAFGVSEFLGYPVSNFILKNYMSIYVISVINAFVTSCWCYVRARYASENSWNPYAKSGSIPIDFAIGREVSPKWFQIADIKLVSYRTSLILTLILAETFIIKNVQLPKFSTDEKITSTQTDETTMSYVATAKFLFENISFDNTSLLMSILLFLYVSDWIFFEHHLAASFELQHEGVGALLLLRYAITPFLVAAIPKYFLENQGVILPWWAVAIIISLFVGGLILKRMSNAVKYRYRMNPHSMEFAYADTVPTFQGRRLLLGAFWGRLRQPNYTGDILSLISFAIPLYWKLAWPPLICISLLILNLFHRAVRVNKRNLARYNSAWVRYCSRVRYLIIPKVF